MLLGQDFNDDDAAQQNPSQLSRFFGLCSLGNQVIWGPATSLPRLWPFLSFHPTKKDHIFFIFYQESNSIYHQPTKIEKMILSALLIPTFPSISCSKNSNPPTSHFQIPTASSQKSHIKILLLSNLASLAFALTLNSPLPSLAIPSLNSGSSLLPPTTPFSQSQDLQIGLENGYLL